MLRRVHPLQGKRITKSEIRQIEFSDENAEHIRHSSKSAISVNITVEEHRQKPSSFFKPKWMRSSDEGQKVSRMVTIKRWLLQSTRPKHQKKKTNNCLKEPLIANELTGLDNPGFIDEETEDEFHACTLKIDVPVCDLPLVDIVTDEMNEKVTTEEHFFDIDFSNFELLSGIPDQTMAHDLCSSTRSSEITIHMVDARFFSVARAVLPPFNANEGECRKISAFSGECTEKENEYDTAKYNQQKVQNKLVTQRLLRKEKRANVLMKRLWEMTGTLVRQSRTITMQNECIENMDKKLSKLGGQLAKKKEKPAVTNVYNVEHVDMLTISSDRSH